MTAVRLHVFGSSRFESSRAWAQVIGRYLSEAVPAVCQKLISFKLKARSTNQNKATTAVMTEPLLKMPLR